TVKTTALAVRSAGEKAKKVRKAIIPTGNNISDIGGGGNGGSIGGNTRSDAVTTASTTTHLTVKHVTIKIFRFSLTPSEL
ncbi:unnamed protein product, partial [Ilex paraguariensis]